ncbi:MAG: alpha/beta hydrolase [Verrucomicrobia bacterium]|nr:alpha/beta hydrolase [Verrucomicrobiota bacterium]
MRKNIRFPIIVALSLAGLFAVASGAFGASGLPKGKKKGPGANADVSRVTPMRDPDKSMVFKKTPQGDLKLYCFLPKDWKAEDKRPGIVFWFGGGFVGGTPTQFYAKAEYLASRGLVCVCAEYRVKNTHGTGLDKCAEDARSAMRWVKQHAPELGVDPGRVIASGGSAGGTLSLLAALGAGPDATDDDISISPKPCALVLFNPAQGEAVMSRIGGEGAERERVVRLIAPLNEPQKGLPPAIFFFGTADQLLIPSRAFCEKSIALGNRCELWTAEGMPHGFFNRQPWHDATLRKADEFLTALGYLKGEPQIKAPAEAVLKRE